MQSRYAAFGLLLRVAEVCLATVLLFAEQMKGLLHGDFFRM